MAAGSFISRRLQVIRSVSGCRSYPGCDSGLFNFLLIRVFDKLWDRYLVR